MGQFTKSPDILAEKVVPHGRTEQQRLLCAEIVAEKPNIDLAAELAEEPIVQLQAHFGHAVDQGMDQIGMHRHAQQELIESDHAVAVAEYS